MMGDKDWTNNLFRKNDYHINSLIEENYVGDGSRCQIVENATHHMYIDNYQKTAGIMLCFEFGLHKADEYLRKVNYQS